MNIKYLLVIIFISAIFGWLFCFYITPHKEIETTTRTIEVKVTVPPETLVVDRWHTRYVQDISSQRIIDSLNDRIKHNDTSAVISVLEKLQPFNTTGESQYYKWNITAQPLTRTFNPFILQMKPFQIDTTFIDTTFVINNNDIHWYWYLLGGVLGGMIIQKTL